MNAHSWRMINRHVCTMSNADVATIVQSYAGRDHLVYGPSRCNIHVPEGMAELCLYNGRYGNGYALYVPVRDVDGIVRNGFVYYIICKEGLSDAERAKRSKG